mgnify:CR=1 FL=1
MDMDVEVVRPFDDLLASPYIFGLGIGERGGGWCIWSRKIQPFFEKKFCLIMKDDLF